MRGRVFAAALPLWTSAYLGCLLLLILGLVAQGSASMQLLAELSWLALIASIPSALVLGAALRTSNARMRVIVVSTLAVVIVAAAIGLEHADFLLSGPRWVLHPRHRLLEIAISLLVGLIGAGGWTWLIVGTRTEGLRSAAWVTVTVLVVGALAAAITRYRAYDYSMAQLVFPAGVLSGAAVYRLVCRSPLRGFALGVAVVCAVYGVGSRLDRTWTTTGYRELIAHSRAGALAVLYVLPQVGRDEPWAANGEPCATPRPMIEESPIGIEADKRRSVILVTVDAVRKDVVGAEIDGRSVTPELVRLAERGVSFENATSPYPATLFAIGSAFTGLSPAELYLSAGLPDTVFTRSRGRVDRQLAVLPDVGWFHLPIVEQLLATGVEIEFARTDTVATEALTDHLRVARAKGESVMAWIHYYSPHDPYQSWPDFPFGKGKRDAYLSEVAFFDRELGRLMRSLEADGWLEDTLVIFFSDHGQALGESSYWGHHVYLNAWLIDVPLVLWHSDLSPARPLVGVSLADVAPTVLHFLGLPLPSDIGAQSLFTLNPARPNRPTFSEAFPVRGRELFDSFVLPALDDASIQERLRSIRMASKGYEPKGAITRDRYRLIHHRGADTSFFYDRDADPKEQLGGSATNREAGKLLKGELEQWEREQLRRIRCRLQLTADQPERSRPE
jgi:arylsulfatase A-like enzyme